MKINPLKLLGDEGVVEPLQFICRHIQPPCTHMKHEKEKWMGTLNWKQFARTLGDSAGVQSSLPNEMKKKSESGGQVESLHMIWVKLIGVHHFWWHMQPPDDINVPWAYESESEKCKGRHSSNSKIWWLQHYRTKFKKSRSWYINVIKWLHVSSKMMNTN